MKQKITNIVICLLTCLIVVMPTGISHAGSNASAGCALDMDYTTRDYDPEDLSKDIDSTLTAEANQEITIAIVAQNVSNLDTYRVEVNFDPNHMKFIEGYEEDAFNGITNLLKTNGGRTIWIAPREKEDAPGKIVMANSLVGSDEDQAPEGTGIIALLKFQMLDADPNNQLTLSGVNYIDTPGSIAEPMVVDSVTNLTNATVNPDTEPITKIASPSSDDAIYKGEAADFQGIVEGGDAPFTYSWNFGASGVENSDKKDPGNVTFQTVGNYTITFTVTDKDGDEGKDSVTVTIKPSCDINGDGQTDLKDIILALQVLVGMNSDNNNIQLADINDDNRIGIAEVIYILKKISGIQES